MPSRSSALRAEAATRREYSESAAGSADQSTFTELAKDPMGFDSTPTLEMPSFLHSTSVVPVPQKGSRTVWERSTPSRSM